MEQQEEQEKEISLRSEDFQEILGNVPSWILRCGISILAIIIVVLLIGCSLFKYPDVISVPMTLTSLQPVAGIVSKSTGKLQKIFVKDKQIVTQGTHLAIIENVANMSDIQYLKHFLTENAWGIDSVLLPQKSINVGELQSLYSAYYIALSEYIQFRKQNYYPQKIEMTQKKIYHSNIYYQKLIQQQKIVNQQLRISKKQYQRDYELKEKKVISDIDFETTYNQYLQTQLLSENMEITIKNHIMQLATLQESLFDIKFQYLNKKEELELHLKSLIMQLQTGIDNWELAYLLKSPIDGRITFTNYWVENQNVTAGEQVFNIVPLNTREYIGRALLPMERSGKVEIGQKVNIDFSNFPSNEFGTVKGIIQNISLVATESNNQNYYLIEIVFPNKLHTNYQKELPFIPEMKGKASIITKNISLLERIFMPLKKILMDNA